MQSLFTYHILLNLSIFYSFLRWFKKMPLVSKTFSCKITLTTLRQVQQTAFIFDILRGKVNNKTTNIRTMPSEALFKPLDRLSPDHPLNGRTSSWLGCIATLLILALCLGFYVPAAISYFKGNYYQSMYDTNINFAHTFYSKDDFKLAIVFRNKQNGTVYNHTYLLNNLKALIYSANHTNVLYYESLQTCNRQYFVNDINGELLEDCLVIPDYVQYDAGYAYFSYSYMYFSIMAPMVTNPFPRSVFVQTIAQKMYTDILTNYFVQFYFTSKDILPDGSLRFHMHRAYSTQINVASDSIGANFNITAGMRVTLMDDSILPWRNYKNVSVMSWSGNYQGTKAQNVQGASTSGVQSAFTVTNSMQVAVRFYKKLDWLLGIIGGGMFLFYIIFWVVFNYFNRSWAKFNLANQLLLQKITEDNPQSEEDLIAVMIPSHYMLRRIIPLFRVKGYEKLLEEAEHENDIVTLIKRQKVTLRNLKKKDLLPPFQSKIVQFSAMDEINKQETSQDEGSQEERSDLEEIVIDVNGNSNNSRQGQHQIELQNFQDTSNINLLNESINNPRDQPNNSEIEIQHSSQEEEDDVRGSNQPFEGNLPKKGILVIHDKEHPVQPPEVFEHLKHQVNPLANKDKNEAAMENVQMPQQSYQPFSQEEPPQQQQIPPAEPVVIQANQQLIVNVPAGQQVIIIGNNQQLAQLNQHPPAEYNEQRHSESPATLSQLSSMLNLTPLQTSLIRQSKQLEKVYENNATFLVLHAQKPDADVYFDLMQMEGYDKWEGHFTLKIKSCAKKCKERVTTVIKYFDFFRVQVGLIDQSNSTLCCGVFLSLLILALSIATVALTMANMSQTQFIISENYSPQNGGDFTKLTDNNFNAVTCVSNPTYITGVTRLATLNLYTVTDGVVKNYTGVQLTNTDNVLNFPSSLQFMPPTFIRTNCYKFPNGIPLTIGKNNSYFGFSLNAYCSSIPSFCNATQNITNSNFLTTVNNIYFLYVLPGTRLDPITNKLVSDVFTLPWINYNLMKMSSNMTLEETALVNQVNLYDDTGTSFMHAAPKLIDQSISYGYNSRRTFVKASTAAQPSYTFKVKLNQAETNYTIRQRKVDWILGIIGGVFVFWYAVVHLLARLYMRFQFNAYIAKIIYEEDGYEDYLLKRILAMLRVPRCLIPRCCDFRKDCERMKAIHDKIDNTLSHLTLLKYTDSCFRLSSSIFSKLQAKNFSLLYFREKIFENEQVVPRVQQVEKKDEEVFETYNMLQDELGDLEKYSQNQVKNSYENNDNLINQKQLQPKEENKVVEYEHQDERDNIIDPKVTKITDYVDIFDQPATFSFRGERTFSSVTGGLCCLFMLLIILIVANYEITFYLAGGGQTTSYDMVIDDAPTSQGISLTTGSNFKIGINFLNSQTLAAINPASYLATVGVSLLVQQFTRTNGIITPNITTIDLVPCPFGYFLSWIAPNVDLGYYSNFNHAYCAPDGINLQISGNPQNSVTKNFKLSIYNKAGNSSGVSNLTTLLNTTFIMLYFSSPRQNSISRVVDYQMQSLLFSNFGGLNPLLPMQTNMTLSKSNITYDDSRDYQSSPLNQLTYRFQPYNQQWLGFNYYGANSSLWFNISFSYTQKMHTYYITTPKFYEVFGLIGGILAFCYFFVSCFSKSFNEYRLRYEIGRELYLFDKKRITESKDKLKRKLRKTENDRKRLRKYNEFGELDVLQAYLLSPFGHLMDNYNFNETLRRVTLVQDRVAKDLDISNFYLNLYRARDAISKNLKNSGITNHKLPDIYFKKIANMNPIQYNISTLRNYVKLHNLSSYQQAIVYRALRAKINILEVLDRNFMENQFNLTEDVSSINLNMMNDTQNSVNSSALSSMQSNAEQSVTGAETEET